MRRYFLHNEPPPSQEPTIEIHLASGFALLKDRVIRCHCFIARFDEAHQFIEDVPLHQYDKLVIDHYERVNAQPEPHYWGHLRGRLPADTVLKFFAQSTRLSGSRLKIHGSCYLRLSENEKTTTVSLRDDTSALYPKQLWPSCQTTGTVLGRKEAYWIPRKYRNTYLTNLDMTHQDANTRTLYEKGGVYQVNIEKTLWIARNDDNYNTRWMRAAYLCNISHNEHLGNYVVFLEATTFTTKPHCKDSLWSWPRYYLHLYPAMREVLSLVDMCFGARYNTKWEEHSPTEGETHE